MSKEIRQIYLNCAGIDISTTNFHVSVAGQAVRIFGTFTKDLENLIDYLKEHHVQRVAMESTSILWLPIYEACENATLTVCLVNGAHYKNVPGRKTDVKDAVWLRELLEFGLLRPSFIPNEQIRVIRTFVRQRETLIEDAAKQVVLMQRALERMNIKIHNVISDIKGKSGMLIIKAIIDGEYRPEVLVDLAVAQVINKKKDLLLNSLKGQYRQEHIFLLKQALTIYEFLHQQAHECDKKIEIELNSLTQYLPKPNLNNQTKSGKTISNPPKIDNLYQKLVQLAKGNDLTKITSLTELSLLKIFAEIGYDLSPWKSAKHFVSWLGLAPPLNQSGGISKKKRIPNRNRIGQIFKESAGGIAYSKHLALTGFYKRIKAKNGGRAAIKATARKMAVIFYNCITKGIEYVEEGLNKYEEKYKNKIMKNLQKRAEELGLKLIQV